MNCAPCQSYRSGVAFATHFVRHQRLEKRSSWLCAHCGFQTLSTQDALLHSLLQGHNPLQLHKTFFKYSDEREDVAPVETTNLDNFGTVRKAKSYAILTNQDIKPFQQVDSDKESNGKGFLGGVYELASHPTSEMNSKVEKRSSIAPESQTDDSIREMDFTNYVDQMYTEEDDRESVSELSTTNVLDISAASFANTSSHSHPTWNEMTENEMSDETFQIKKRPRKPKASKLYDTKPVRSAKPKASKKPKPAKREKRIPSDPNHRKPSKITVVTITCRRCAKVLNPKQYCVKQIKAQHATSCCKIKPLACSECDVRFNQKAYFLMHLKIRAGACDGARMVRLDKEEEKKVKEAVDLCFPDENVY